MAGWNNTIALIHTLSRGSDSKAYPSKKALKICSPESKVISYKIMKQ